MGNPGKPESIGASRAGSAPEVTPALSRQAGGHWFEPSTAHLGSPRKTGVFVYSDGDGATSVSNECRHLSGIGEVGCRRRHRLPCSVPSGPGRTTTPLLGERPRLAKGRDRGTPSRTGRRSLREGDPQRPASFRSIFSRFSLARSRSWLLTLAVCTRMASEMRPRTDDGRCRGRIDASRRVRRLR